MANGENTRRVAEMLRDGRLDIAQAFELVLDKLASIEDKLDKGDELRETYHQDVSRRLEILEKDNMQYRPWVWYIQHRPAAAAAWFIGLALTSAFFFGLLGTAGLFRWLFSIIGSPF